MKRPKVLVVDDQPRNLHAMRHVLRPLDLELFEAESGNEGLALCLDHDFAVILMDVQMPEMDGFEAAAHIRGNDQTSHMPIIFVTAFEKGEMQAFDDSLTAYDYLYKPVDDKILKSKVKFFLELYHHKQKVVEQNSQFNTVLENMGEGVVVANSDGQLIHFNAAAESMMGAGLTDSPPEEWSKEYGLFHTRGDTLLDEEELPLVRALKGEKVEGEKIFVRNARHQKGIHVQMTATPMKNNAGVVLGAVAVMRDVTKQIDYETSLKNSKELAEKAVQLKADFLANMSHEIRTPINGVIGACDLLMETDQNTEQKELTEIVSHSARSLLTIINDILDSSKIEAGKMNIEMLSIDLKRILNDVIQILKNIQHENDLVLELNCPEDLPELLVGDPTRIRQILLNLVGNAIKFTERGSVVVDVSFERKQAESYLIAIAVKDTGIGMAPAQLENIFTSFAQADNSISRKYGGTGLGLSISNRLAEMMGGSIRVESEEGKGSVFTLELPMQRTSKKYLDESSAPGALNRNYQKKILLAEDNRVNQKVAIKILNTLGIDIDLARNGLEAQEMFFGGGYAMVLMDMQMPECDGLTATREIRKNDKKTPILALTANAMRDEQAQCLESGMDGFITKPISKKVIVRELDKWFT